MREKSSFIFSTVITIIFERKNNRLIHIYKIYCIVYYFTLPKIFRTRYNFVRTHNLTVNSIIRVNPVVRCGNKRRHRPPEEARLQTCGAYRPSLRRVACPVAGCLR